MTKKLMGIAIVFLLVISFSGVGYADDPLYVIGYKRLRHHVLENGKTMNKMVVGMYYNNGQQDLTDENVIEEIWLYRLDPTEEVLIDLYDVEIFDGIWETYPYYNCYIGCEFENWEKSTYYYRDIHDELEPGNYRIEVKCIDEDILYTDTFSYRGEIDLPAVSSKTIKYRFDNAGNFYCNWEIPKDLFYLDPSFFDVTDWDKHPYARVMLEFYNNGVHTGLAWIRVPYLMSGALIPVSSDLFNNGVFDYDHVEIGIQVRLVDDSTRSYSNYKPIKIK